MKTVKIIGPTSASLAERQLQSLLATATLASCTPAIGPNGEVLLVVVLGPAAPAEAPAPRPAERPDEPLAGDEGAPPCPRCAGGMVRRFRKADGKAFWGCAGFPDCNGIVNIAPGAPAKAPAAQVSPQLAIFGGEDADGNVPF
jgi:hypothetical protein